MESWWVGDSDCTEEAERPPMESILLNMSGGLRRS